MSTKQVNFGEVEYGQTVFDTITIRNNWLYDIRLSSALQYYSPEVFTLPEGELNNDTIKINNDDSLQLIVQYTPNSTGGDVADSTAIRISWDKVANTLNYSEFIDLLGKGVDPVGVEDETSPTEFMLYQNYPNPFNPTTTINYSIPSVIARSPDEVGATRQSNASSTNQQIASPRQGVVRNDVANVKLKVYDILGREVATLVNQKQAPGNYSVQFDASKLTSGIYFYTIRTNDFTSTRKMILMK